MNGCGRIVRNGLPPRLTMDEYVKFLTELQKTLDPQKARRQKQMQERIVHPFAFCPQDNPNHEKYAIHV